MYPPFPPSLEPGRPLAGDEYRKDTSTMQPPLLTLEIHAKAVREKHLSRMYEQELLRATNANRMHPFRTVIRTVRNAVGAFLVAIGNRMQAGGSAPGRAAGTT